MAMTTRKAVSCLLAVAACLPLAGCDSKNPLSDPAQSKPDPRLAGVWRWKDPSGVVEYYHVGRAGGKLPDSVTQLIGVTHHGDGHLTGSAVVLMFPAVLGNTAFLNVGMEGSNHQQGAVDRLKREGWTPGVLESYSIFKYRVEGDAILLWQMTAVAMKQAVTSGKIKGSLAEQGKIGVSRFTDTTENVARFVAAAGDSLFEKEPKRLERVK